MGDEQLEKVKLQRDEMLNILFVVKDLSREIPGKPLVGATARFDYIHKLASDALEKYGAKEE